MRSQKAAGRTIQKLLRSLIATGAVSMSGLASAPSICRTGIRAELWIQRMRIRQPQCEPWQRTATGKTMNKAFHRMANTNTGPAASVRSVDVSARYRSSASFSLL
eukprot:6311195-Prymnesium_polylepis.2